MKLRKSVVFILIFLLLLSFPFMVLADGSSGDTTITGNVGITIYMPEDEDIEYPPDFGNGNDGGADSFIPGGIPNIPVTPPTQTEGDSEPYGTNNEDGVTVIDDPIIPLTPYVPEDDVNETIIIDTPPPLAQFSETVRNRVPCLWWWLLLIPLIGLGLFFLLFWLRKKRVRYINDIDEEIFIQKVRRGKKIEIPEKVLELTNNNTKWYWYKEKELLILWDFEKDKVKKHIKLYMKKNPSVEPNSDKAENR